MQAEEAVREIGQAVVGIVIAQIEVLQFGRHPSGGVVMVAVAVVLIVHDFAIIDMSRMINLPEDDTTITSHAEAIAQGSMLHLLLSEIAVGHNGTTEMTVGAEVLLPEWRRRIAVMQNEIA